MNAWKLFIYKRRACRRTLKYCPIVARKNTTYIESSLFEQKTKSIESNSCNYSTKKKIYKCYCSIDRTYTCNICDVLCDVRCAICDDMREKKIKQLIKHKKVLVSTSAVSAPYFILYKAVILCARSIYSKVIVGL